MGTVVHSIPTIQHQLPVNGVINSSGETEEIQQDVSRQLAVSIQEVAQSVVGKATASLRALPTDLTENYRG